MPATYFAPSAVFVAQWKCLPSISLLLFAEGLCFDAKGGEITFLEPQSYLKRNFIELGGLIYGGILKQSDMIIQHEVGNLEV